MSEQRSPSPSTRTSSGEEELTKPRGARKNLDEVSAPRSKLVKRVLPPRYSQNYTYLRILLGAASPEDDELFRIGKVIDAAVPVCQQKPPHPHESAAKKPFAKQKVPTQLQPITDDRPPVIDWSDPPPNINGRPSSLFSDIQRQVVQGTAVSEQDFASSLFLGGASFFGRFRTGPVGVSQAPSLNAPVTLI